MAALWGMAYNIVMENKFYTYDDDRHGWITIYDPEGNDIAFLQGEDDTEQLRKEIEQVEKIWFTKVNQHGCRKKFGPFKSFEEHLSIILGQYDID
jgi:hypothetical protein